MQLSTIHSSLSAKGHRPASMDELAGVPLEQLRKIGLDLPETLARDMARSYGMDSLQSLTTTASIGTPVQFLQFFLPGFVDVLQAKRKIDDLVGLQIVGAWEDQQIVQGIAERTGAPRPYSDDGNTTYSNSNPNFEVRTVQRFEQGMRVGTYESASYARMRLSVDNEKRAGAATSLDITRNAIGFYGYNDGLSRTYGFLNEPELAPYVIVPTGASGQTTWDSKTVVEQIRDISTGLSSLRKNTKELVDPDNDYITLAVSTAAREALSRTTEFGPSASTMDWLRRTYPKVRVVSAPELDNAHSNQNVFYMYADNVMDSGTDGGQTWVQMVPTRFRVLGVQQLAKAYEEVFSNATAGLLLKRPYAVVRYYGI
jgi:hypothetical protein